MPCIRLRKFPSIHGLQTFYQKWMLDLSNPFSPSLVCSQSKWCWLTFKCKQHSCHWNKFYLVITYYSFSKILLDSICEDSIENFCMFVHVRYCSVVLYSCNISMCFWYQVTLVSQNACLCNGFTFDTYPHDTGLTRMVCFLFSIVGSRVTELTLWPTMGLPLDNDHVCQAARLSLKASPFFRVPLKFYFLACLGQRPATCSQEPWLETSSFPAH